MLNFYPTRLERIKPCVIHWHKTAFIFPFLVLTQIFFNYSDWNQFLNFRLQQTIGAKFLQTWMYISKIFVPFLFCAIYVNLWPPLDPCFICTAIYNSITVIGSHESHFLTLSLLQSLLNFRPQGLYNTIEPGIFTCIRLNFHFTSLRVIQAKYSYISILYLQNTFFYFLHWTTECDFLIAISYLYKVLMAKTLDKEQEYWTCIKTYWKYKQ